MKQKLLTIILALFATANVWAYSFKAGELYYEIIDGASKTVEVTYDYDYDRYYLSKITIPESVSYNDTEYKVIGIGRNAFYHCEKLSQITIPNSVESIGEDAFSGCTALTQVTIPNSVTSIGEDAFSGCTALTQVTIPNSVTSIRDHTFSGCTALSQITIPNSVTSIGNRTFYNSGLTQVTIPNSVTRIAFEAFSGCTALTQVTISNSVTSIEGFVFQGCTALSQITIPNGVTRIDAHAFRNCTALSQVTISNSVESIHDSAFDGCTMLSQVTWNAINCNINFPIFRDCPIDKFTFGDQVEHIPAYLCIDMSNLREITIPNSVTSIGDNAFYGCKALSQIIWNAVNLPDFTRDNRPFADCPVTDFTFGEQVEHIPAYLCYGMDQLTQAIIPENVKSIGSSVFAGCTMLSHVTLGNNVTSIGDRAFSNCEELRQITMPNSLTNIGNEAFASCTNLLEAIIPASVTNIGDKAFSNCVALTAINVDNNNIAYCSENGVLFDFNKTTLIQFPINKDETIYSIPNNVKNIESMAFAGCFKLSQITIPNSVTSIGDKAFNGCEALTAIHVENGNTAYCSENGVLFNIDKTTLIHYPNSKEETSITIPNDVTSIESMAFAGCSTLTQITIPNSVTSIGDKAFYGCKALSQVIWNAVNLPDFTRDNRPFADCPVTDFTFGEQVEHIPAYLCYGMDKLTQAIISENVKSIGNSVFTGCTMLSHVTWNVTNLQDFTRDNRPFADCPVTDFTFGEQVEHIPAYLCYDMSNLTQAIIPENVKSIGNSVFAGCTALSEVTIGNNVTNMGNSVFAGCTMLSHVTLGNNVTSIGESVFEGCTALSQITIPNSITNIGGSAFAGCTNLSQVTWNATNYEDFTSSDNRPFADCPVNKVAFGNLVEHIPAYLCYGMTQLTSLSLPNSVKTIGTGAFCQSGFMSIVMPAGITESGTDAFKDCNKLNNIIFDGNVAEWCGIDFKNNAANPIFSASENVKLYINYQPVSTLVIPEGVTEIRNHAFNKAAFLTSIDIPESVTAIGESAFAGCSALNSIYCRAIVPPTIEATTFSETDHTIPLYIPMESNVQYKIADHWNGFTNQHYLTTQQPLTVTYYVEGSDAYFFSNIEYGESFQCNTAAAEGKEIITITLNGKDITDQLGENGLLTIENVTEDCTIIISTDDKTSATETVQDTAKFRAWQSKGEIFVEHTDDMVYVTVYDLNGRIIKQEKTTGYGVLRIPVTDNLLHIVQANYSDGTSATKKVQ